jgi:hypothetical protein
VTVPKEILDLLAQYTTPPEIESDYQARISDLSVQVRRRHSSYMYSLFRRRAWNEADVEELVNETVGRYLFDVDVMLRVTEGLHSSLEPLVENGELIGLSLPATVKPIPDLETYTFASPGGWFATIANSVLREYARRSAKASERAKAIDRAARFPTRRNGEPQYFQPSVVARIVYGPRRNIEQFLVNQCRNKEIRERYVAALQQVGPVQRAAWILCKDEILTTMQAEPLLATALHWRSARAALRARPIQDAEASRLLNRIDVSPDAAKARAKLAEQLSDLDPLKASRMPASKWAREFLVSSFVRSGSIQSSIHRGSRSLSEEHRDYVDHVSQLRRQSERKDSKSSDEEQLSRNLVGAWFQPERTKVNPARTDRVQTKALREISYSSGSCAYCGGRSVRKSFSPNAVGWNYWCYQCGAKDDLCQTERQEDTGQDATRESKDRSTQTRQDDPKASDNIVIPEPAGGVVNTRKAARQPHPEPAEHRPPTAHRGNKTPKKAVARAKRYSKTATKRQRKSLQRLTTKNAITAPRPKRAKRATPVKTARRSKVGATASEKVPHRGKAIKKVRRKIRRSRHASRDGKATA